MGKTIKMDCRGVSVREKDYTELVYWVWMYFGGCVLLPLFLLASMQGLIPNWLPSLCFLFLVLMFYVGYSIHIWEKYK